MADDQVDGRLLTHFEGAMDQAPVLGIHPNFAKLTLEKNCNHHRYTRAHHESHHAPNNKLARTVLEDAAIECADAQFRRHQGELIYLPRDKNPGVIRSPISHYNPSRVEASENEGR